MEQILDQQTLTNIIYVAIFLIGALLFGFGPIIIVKLISPSSHTRNIENKTGQFIECGIEPIGSAWIRFGIVYYLYALIFLAFDVDVLFLFPVAVAYNNPEFVVRDLVEVLIFVGILSLAVVYAWVKGVFNWEQKKYHHQ
ncbi:MAG: NADH-quinone oxidoreductase subunit A [Desulfobulbaceae bacterium]|jgi:NADH:ubiquinone oxidoreductase subunit 3 (subunit A)|nr:NADH-quinone oxidoreductase subunit A [Desulfobulbaceae bacterium]